MSDMISRSALIEEIEKRSKYYLGDWDSFRKYTGGRAEESYAHFKEDEAIIKIANNLPAVEPVRGECSDCSRRKFYQKGCEDGLNASKWIPVSERLPGETDYPEQRFRVLASCSDGIVRNTTIKSLRNTEEEHRSRGNFFTYVAWQPLPEPYREKVEE